MRDLLERTEYLLNGGVLSLLSESLAAHSERGMILRPEGEDMEVLEAFGASVESLFMKGRAGEIKGAFPSSSIRGDYDVSAARLVGEWPWSLRIRGWDWAFYVLLSDEPSASLMEDMPSFAGLIALWQRHQRIVGVEERLSRLAYMVLATKSTLASVFEPMGLPYFGAFLRDVVMESLFPSRLSILLDRGGELSLLAGEDLPLPPRSGIFARDILSPALARIDGASPESVGAEVFRALSGGWSAILPIIGGDARLFCLLKWEKQLGEEALNFIELLGNVASKALSMAAMREEKDRNLRALSGSLPSERPLRGVAQAPGAVVQGDPASSGAGHILRDVARGEDRAGGLAARCRRVRAVRGEGGRSGDARRAAAGVAGGRIGGQASGVADRGRVSPPVRGDERAVPVLPRGYERSGQGVPALGGGRTGRFRGRLGPAPRHQPHGRGDP